jgi:ribosomal subunit interface protein
MDMDLTARHGIKIDGEVREMLENKVSKLTRFSRKIVATHVIVEKDGSELLLELSVTASKKVFVARSRAFDLVDAIEDAVDKMSKQLRRSGEKYKDKKKETGVDREVRER